MKRNIIILVMMTLIGASFLYAQTKVDTIYYDKEWNRVSKSPFADYYRIATYYDDTTKRNTFCDYYITGEPQSSPGYFISLGDVNDRNSIFYHSDTSYTYYKSGQTEFVNIYNKEGKLLQNLCYDEYGTLKGKTECLDDGDILYLYGDYGTKKIELTKNGTQRYSYYEYTFWDGITLKFKTDDDSPYDDEARKGLKRYHPINGYKYILIAPNFDKILQGVYYDERLCAKVENSLSDYFTSKGFSVLTQGAKNLSSDMYLIFCEYDWSINYDGPSQIAISLSHDTKNQIWGCLKKGNSLTPWGDLNMGLNKIYEEFDKLNYKFNPQMLPHERQVSKAKLLPKLVVSKWSKDKIVSYFDNNKISHIEGIYKEYDGGSTYAVLKENGKYYAIVINEEKKDKYFENGDARYEFTPIEGGVYDAVIYWENNKSNGLATIDGRILTIAYKLSEMEMSDKYLKIYPSNEGPSIQAKTDTNSPSATGSGVVISSGIVVTNYHVIEAAKKIEVGLIVNGEKVTYAAKLLCADKQNDLALISIKDEKYKGSNPPPFRIMNSNVDVGTSIFTMGYPLADILGQEVKVTDGIISSRSGYDGNITTYQISAAIQPGNSGGALFDKKGDLVGITNAGVQAAQNVGYAIKSIYLLNLIDSAPINITLPKGQDFQNTDLPTMLKAFSPYIAYIIAY